MPFYSFNNKRQWFFDQGIAMKAVDNSCSAAHHGSCHNFSLEWLHLVHTQSAANISMEVGAQARQTRMKISSSVKNAIVTQTAFARAWGDEGYESADKMMAQLREIALEVVMPMQAFSATDIAQVINSTGRTGYVLSFWFAQNGGHSIALYRSGGTGLFGGGHVTVFDPNLGEYRMNPGDFKGWLQHFIAHYNAYFRSSVGEVAKGAMKSAAPQAYDFRGRH